MIIFLILFGIFIIAVDQIIKIWAFNNLMPVGQMDFIKFGSFDVLGLSYAENDGAAFSNFSGARYFLIILNIILIAGLIFYAVKYCKKDKLMLVATAMVVSGGIGNIIDRIRLGYVIDYLEVRMFNFAIFNFADMFVVVGACLLLLSTFFTEYRKEKAAKSNG